MSIQVLSPTGREPDRTHVAVVPPLLTLEGARLGLLDNSKKNANVLLESVGASLARDVPRLQVRLWQKGEGTGAAGAAPEAVLRDMASSVGAALVALGD